MVRVLFFARLREQLDCEQQELEWCEGLTLAVLRQQLMAKGERWQEVLGAGNIVAAVDQVVAGDEQAIADNSEVAFFPPVTGG